MLCLGADIANARTPERPNAQQYTPSKLITVYIHLGIMVAEDHPLELLDQ